MKQSGIYQIVNAVNGKLYVGSAVDMPRRRRQHWHDLRRNKHCNSKLQRSWNKYGERAFVFKPLVVCDKENCVLYEQIALDVLTPELNINRQATSRLGVIASDSAREKMRAAKLGRPGPWAGRTLTAEHKKKLSLARMGKKPANYGVPCSEEQKARIRAKLTKPKPPLVAKPPRVYRQVVNIESGDWYRSVADAARSLGISADALRFKPDGRVANRTPMRYADGHLG